MFSKILESENLRMLQQFMCQKVHEIAIALVRISLACSRKHKLANKLLISPTKNEFVPEPGRTL